ncbi:hypothetical protein ACQR3P_28775 [Rhodococcus sp. IEGM1300]
MTDIHPLVLFIFIVVVLALIVDLIFSLLRSKEQHLFYEVTSLTHVNIPGRDEGYRLLLKSSKGNLIDVDIDEPLYDRVALLSTYASPVNYLVIHTNKALPFKELSYEEVTSLELRYLEGHEPLNRSV